MSPNEPSAPAVGPVRQGESLSDKWFRVRNFLLTHPRFHWWAVRLPIFRWVAKRRAAALFELCAGFVYSQVLFAGVRLRLFEFLAEGPQTAVELAPRLGLRLEAARRLLDAAAALKLAERRPGERYGLGIHGASLVATPAVAQMVLHHGIFYRDLVDPVGLLSREAPDTELRRYWSYSGHGGNDQSTAAQVAEYSELMASSMSLIAEDILDAYPLQQHQHLLDLAGGAGAFVQAAAREQHLKLTMFDLPPVAERARARLSGLGLGERITVCGGDLFTTPLPSGADVVSLVRVVHDHDDGQALKILKAARTALGPRGVLLLAEPMSGTPGAEAMSDAYFGLYLYSMGQGRARTSQTLIQFLRDAGFAGAREVPTRRPMLTKLIVAHVS